MSAWNFDVAALKSNAALEGATELATVPEAPGNTLTLVSLLPHVFEQLQSSSLQLLPLLPFKTQYMVAKLAQH